MAINSFPIETTTFDLGSVAENVALAEQYKDDAEAAKDSAETSATNAENSESNAATSESNAATSEANASASASSAATSESNAATSESNAATSESNAAISETNAAASASDAEAARDASAVSADLSQAWAEGTEPGGAGTKSAKEWAEDAEDAAEAAGAPYASRAVAIASDIPASVQRISVIHDGMVLEYVRDASGTALTTADGATWSPGSPVFLEHYGVTTSVDKTAPTVDYTSEVQAALTATRGELIFTGFVKITDQINVPNYCQPVCPLGRTYGGFSVFSDFNMSAACVMKLGTSEAGPTLGDFCIWFEQPSAPADRSELIQYPWAVDTAYIPRTIFNTLRIENGWDGVKADGNAGGMRFDVFELGCFNTNILFDGALDFIHGDSLQCWPFGFAGNSALTDVFYDESTVAMSLGRVDGLVIDKVSIFRCKIETISAAADSSIPMTINSLSLDGDGARLIVDKNIVKVGELYSTKTGGPTDADIQVSGGMCFVDQLYANGQPDTILDVSGGLLKISGGYLKNNDNAKYFAALSGGRLDIQNVQFEWADGTVRTVAGVKTTGGQLVFKNNHTDNISNPGVFVNVGLANALHDIDMSTMYPFTVNTPTNTTGGFYKNRGGNSLEISDEQVARYEDVYADAGEGVREFPSRARGARTAPASVNVNDIVHAISPRGYASATGWQIGGFFRALVDHVSASVVGTRWDFLLRDTSGAFKIPLRVQHDGITATVKSLDLSELGEYADDTAAASGGVDVGNAYINSTTGALTKRIS